MADWLTKLAEGAGAVDPHGLAERLMLVMEGAIVTAQVSGSDAAGVAKGLAVHLLSTAFP
jgi:hypothetical protein